MIKKIISVTALLFPLYAQAGGLNCQSQIENFCRGYDANHMNFSVPSCISDLSTAFSQGKEAAMSELKRTRVLAEGVRLPVAGGYRTDPPYMGSFFEGAQSGGAFPQDSWQQLLICAGGKSGGHQKEEKKEDECKAKPSFDSKVEVEQVGDSLPYCWAKMKNTSAFPITCNVTNDRGQQIRRWTIYPGRDTGYGWPLLASNEQCHANFNCERTKDLSTNKPARYGKCD